MFIINNNERSINRLNQYLLIFGAITPKIAMDQIKRISVKSVVAKFVHFWKSIRRFYLLNAKEPSAQNRDAEPFDLFAKLAASNL